VGLGVNLGGEAVFADQTEEEYWFSSAVGFDLSDRLAGFLEYFTFTEELDDFTSYTDAGITYLVHDDLQLDARVGFGLGEADDEIFWGLGVVARY